MKPAGGWAVTSGPAKTVLRPEGQREDDVPSVKGPPAAVASSAARDPCVYVSGGAGPLTTFSSCPSSPPPVPPIGQTQLEASKDTEQVGKVRVGLQMGNI